VIDTTGLFATFGDIIELDFPTWDIHKATNILTTKQEWKPYNPRKSNNRFGLSVTSLDGDFSGIPDLDSLIEFNKINNTSFKEQDFNVRTPIVAEIPELEPLLDSFNALGRCHFLRLDSGGFFPPHRDNGTMIPSPSFRIIVPLTNSNNHQWKWIQEDRVIRLTPGRTYCINTSKEHSVFSFVDNCIMLVMNVPSSPVTCLQVSMKKLIN